MKKYFSIIHHSDKNNTPPDKPIPNDFITGEWLYINDDGVIIKRKPIKNVLEFLNKLRIACNDKIYKNGLPIN